VDRQVARPRHQAVGTASLIFLGDVMLGRLVNQELKRRPPEYVWGNTLYLLRQAAAVFINLECAITDWGEPVPGKRFCFRTDSKNVEVLRVAGVRGVCLANNHIMDYGDAGLLETLANLDRAGIAHAGAGRNLPEARKAAELEVAGLKVAFIAATDNQPDWEATEDHPGVFYVPIKPADPRFGALLELVAAAKARSDLVIVSLHWGPNWGYDPPAEHRPAARRLVEAGADIIHGHSAHIFRGIELMGGRPVFYSCGDFVDDYAVDEVERNDWSFIFEVELSGPKISKVILTPTIIADFQARLAPAPYREAILSRMLALCFKFGTPVKQVNDRLEITVG